MLLIKYKGNFPPSLPLPASFKLLAGSTFIFGEGDLSSYSTQQIVDYHIVEITDPILTGRLELNAHTIHTDGTVRLYGTGANWLSDPLLGSDLVEFLNGAKYLAKINAAIEYEKKFSVISSNETSLERATWAQQLSEATAYLASGIPPVLVAQLAASRNLTVDQYAHNVIDANTAYTNNVNLLVSELKAHYQTIDNANSPQVLKDTGWI